ncbi:hypothetical protein HN51_009065 [Arachis hypogaea]
MVAAATEYGSSIKQVAKKLINEGGWIGFYRGFGPRLFSMSMMGTSIILTSEYLKHVCTKDEKGHFGLQALSFVL